MQPRVLFRTHYQVDEPVYAAVLVKACTSPVRSAYDESVAGRLSGEVRAQSRDFNVAAAAYALDLARGLGLVNGQNVWTGKGHLLNMVAQTRAGPWDNGLELAFPEKLLFFRLFLDADGAALLFIAERLLKHGRIPTPDDDWNTLAKQLFLDVYNEYLQLSGTTADRVALRREMDRIRTKGYAGKSGTHKLFIHLQTLHRLGLANRVPTGGPRIYEAGEECRPRLRALVDALPGVHVLEEVVRKRRWPEIAARVFDRGAETTELGGHDLLRMLVPKYEAVASTGVPLCPLLPVIEAVQIDMLTQACIFVTYEGALQILQGIQRQKPSDVRFHVDRRGTPAFLRLSDGLTEEYGQPGGAVGTS